MSESERDIGALESFGEFPAEISLDGEPYWLTRIPEGEYRLLLAICPHAGGEIRPMNDVLFCPLHFWTFSADKGICMNDPDERLMQRRVILKENRLYAVGDNY
ncbi:Rieske (2Fe-2S) protein [Cohnella luojiensis]|uniref:Rieske (2Fe-2S) protein n=1 Tax=Cohnella luojiensis TaxID=652876 RepID=A0A4Y8LST0_9BACL|nr:Rieske (2Fe-2S) protein [Cohnella luojiensis]TFE19764.1 Rieske (2Fe-2S) protein [Cohnella luojiensis]